MGRLANNKGLVLMTKDGVTHEFVLSSVPVWKAKGWSVEEQPEEKRQNEVTELLLEEAQAKSEDAEDPDAKVHEALSTEPKAVTGPKTQKK